MYEEQGKNKGMLAVGRQVKRGLRSFQLLTNASFSFTAKFKDKVDILSNIAKAKVDSLAGQGSKSEGECKKGQCCLPYCTVIPHIASSQYPMTGKEMLQYDRFYYWSQVAAVIMQQKSIDVH